MLTAQQIRESYRRGLLGLGLEGVQVCDSHPAPGLDLPSAGQLEQVGQGGQPFLGTIRAVEGTGASGMHRRNRSKSTPRIWARAQRSKEEINRMEAETRQRKGVGWWETRVQGPDGQLFPHSPALQPQPRQLRGLQGACFPGSAQPAHLGQRWQRA